MPLLPKELGAAEEWAGRFLPPDDRAPLVVDLGEVAIGGDEPLVHVGEKDLRGRADDEGVGKLLAPADGGHQGLRGESIDMLLLLIE